MKPNDTHRDNRNEATLDADKWPEQDSPGDRRGLPGYPREQKDGGEQRTVDPDLGFDPDSPDVSDPQIDPPEPPRIPDNPPDPREERRAPSDEYPPYEKK
ncbi:hypothetical protein [Pseudomonas sp.]|uniref:hypothetical protein n=1 Tax=Pseudomonas sp. TaxID=306 RepID=UPI002CE3B5F1|nr:hypothetical protein [Pseudomonas sp.]